MDLDRMQSQVMPRADSSRLETLSRGLRVGERWNSHPGRAVLQRNRLRHLETGLMCRISKSIILAGWLLALAACGTPEGTHAGTQQPPVSRAATEPLGGGGGGY